MTSASLAANNDQHPEVAEISAFAEGLLPADRSTQVQSHLSECVLCADVHSSLNEIRNALGTLPGPARMPEDIASRIDAALAAEALLDATGGVSRETTWDGPTNIGTLQQPPQVLSQSVNTSTTASGENSPRAMAARVSRETPPRAVERPATRPHRSTGPGRDRRVVRYRRRAVILGAAGLAIALGLSGFFLQYAEEMTDASGAQGISALPGAAPDDLEHRVHLLLTQEKAADAPAAGNQEHNPQDTDSKDTDSKDTAPLADTGLTVPACVRKGIGRTETPLAVDEQVFEGVRSYVVVLPHATDADRVDAYAVDAGCATDEAVAAGTVLARGSYPRG